MKDAVSNLNCVKTLSSTASVYVWQPKVTVKNLAFWSSQVWISAWRSAFLRIFLVAPNKYWVTTVLPCPILFCHLRWFCMYRVSSDFMSILQNLLPGTISSQVCHINIIGPILNSYKNMATRDVAWVWNYMIYLLQKRFSSVYSMVWKKNYYSGE